MEQGNFISGIYNHCDRWCERCILSNRCVVYYEEKKHLDANNASDDFTAIISKNLKKTIELLHKVAEEKGINLDDIESEETETRRDKFKAAMEHPLPSAAKEYAMRLSEWLHTENAIKIKEKEVLQNIDLGVNLDQSDQHLRLIDEALSILSWYEFQIPVKLTSAINNYPHNPDFEDEIQNMYHSSAKIAMIGIENSMKAWQSLLTILPDNDAIINFLIQLQKIKSAVEKKFPNLHKFKRPGFDD